MKSILTLTIKYGEGFDIGDSRIAIEKKSGSECKVYIKAPKTVKINRYRKMTLESDPLDETQTTSRRGNDKERQT